MAVDCVHIICVVELAQKNFESVMQRAIRQNPRTNSCDFSVRCYLF